MRAVRNQASPIDSKQLPTISLMKMLAQPFPCKEPNININRLGHLLINKSGLNRQSLVINNIKAPSNLNCSFADNKSCIENKTSGLIVEDDEMVNRLLYPEIEKQKYKEQKDDYYKKPIFMEKEGIVEEKLERKPRRQLKIRCKRLRLYRKCLSDAFRYSLMNCYKLGNRGIEGTSIKIIKPTHILDTNLTIPRLCTYDEFFNNKGVKSCISSPSTTADESIEIPINESSDGNHYSRKGLFNREIHKFLSNHKKGSLINANKSLVSYLNTTKALEDYFKNPLSFFKNIETDRLDLRFAVKFSEEELVQQRQFRATLKNIAIEYTINRILNPAANKVLQTKLLVLIKSYVTLGRTLKECFRELINYIRNEETMFKFGGYLLNALEVIKFQLKELTLNMIEPCSSNKKSRKKITKNKKTIESESDLSEASINS